MMAIVLPDDLLAVQLPQARIVIRTCRDQIGRIGAKGTVPDPALMTGEGGFQLEWFALWLLG